MNGCVGTFILTSRTPTSCGGVPRMDCRYRAGLCTPFPEEPDKGVLLQTHALSSFRESSDRCVLRFSAWGVAEIRYVQQHHPRRGQA